MPLSNAQESPLWINALLFAAAAAVVWAAGTRLSRYVDGISAQTWMGGAFAGMLVLGGITSLPEVANVATSAAAGNPRLGINNLLGSAAINVLLLALADALVVRAAVTSIVVQASTLMMCTLCMLVLTAVAAAVVIGDRLVFGVGAGAALLCALSIASFWIAASYEQRAPWSVASRGDMRERGGRHVARMPLASLARRTVVAGVSIFAAGYVLSQTGDALAVQTGIGTGMVGFALIGVATSLPELSTVVGAFRIRRYEMAFGQVLGTNFVNLSLILLADIVFPGGPVIAQLGQFEVVSSLLGATLIGLFLVGLLERRNPRILRLGYDSLAVIIVFAAGLIVLARIQ